MGDLVVSLEGVSKRYGPIQALADVSLELRAGEVHCLAGENGAGKSTLIKILTGAVQRDGGAYEIEGREMGDPSPAEWRSASGSGWTPRTRSTSPPRSGPVGSCSRTTPSSRT